MIKVDLGIQNGGPVHAFFTAECAKAMDKYVPFYNGDLAGTVIQGGQPTSNVTVDTITYDQPYALYQYFGKKMVMSNGKSAFYSPDYGFWSKKGEKKTLTNIDLVYHKDMHKLAGPFWDARMWSAEGNDVIRRVQDYYDKRGGK